MQGRAGQGLGVCTLLLHLVAVGEELLHEQLALDGVAF